MPDLRIYQERVRVRGMDEEKGGSPLAPAPGQTCLLVLCACTPVSQLSWLVGGQWEEPEKDPFN